MKLFPVGFTVMVSIKKSKFPVNTPRWNTVNDHSRTGVIFVTPPLVSLRGNKEMSVLFSGYLLLNSIIQGLVPSPPQNEMG